MSVRDKILLYIAIAYGWSWLFWLPTAARDSGHSVPDAWARLGVAGFALGGWGWLVAAFQASVVLFGLQAMAVALVVWRYGPRTLAPERV